MTLLVLRDKPRFMPSPFLVLLTFQVLNALRFLRGFVSTSRYMKYGRC